MSAARLGLQGVSVASAFDTERTLVELALEFESWHQRLCVFFSVGHGDFC
jgi:hypothetical protein